MKLPSTVKLGGHTIEVQETETEDWYGRYHRAGLLIEIRKDQSPSQKAASLLHELLHAIWGESDLPKKFNENGEEEVVTVFEGGLYDLIRNNPKFIEYIRRGGE